MPTKCYTTGQIAKICQVAPRTVSKWFDAGRLGGYRIPGSMDRRVPRNELIRFLRENDMPTYGMMEDGLLTVMTVAITELLQSQLQHLSSVEGYRWVPVPDSFRMGMEMHSIPDVVIIDFSLGRQHCISIVTHLHEKFDKYRMTFIGLVFEDESSMEDLMAVGYTAIYQSPFNAQGIMDMISEVRRKKNGV